MARFSLEEGNAERRKRSRVGRWKEEACSKRGEDSELGEGDDQERTGIDEHEIGLEGAEDEASCHERGESSGDAGVCVRIDPDVLDCSICFEPLQPPIFQCQNGHVACPSCCSKLSNKCYLCSHTIRYSRCLILEKVIESIKFSCNYEKYGCNRTMAYTEKHAHEEACSYAPCFCPVSECYFDGSREMLSAHFINEHTPYVRFKYDQVFKVELHEPREIDPFRALYGEDGHLFLLLNDSFAGLGNKLSMVCFRPKSLKLEFSYKLTVERHDSDCASCLKFKSSATDITEWHGSYPRNVFLMVPSGFCTPKRMIAVDVCIRKIKHTAAT
ncbi:putative E3 ubiquitin-protein ligase SINA-like 6 [Zingiber officinale]|uniref:RING-type E3 ubiquitin transferase n=1 Tax=Zingiber officinale TaxID=94328 RepID=A0A8J5EXA0_ZINOF|nr:putative E3 ubiquitin-protein ligase SINA-like 6 [Zingiber officinale]KAG6476336.1 hypothetical protein ZIOFF_065576 [Zingiber officinale]